MNLITFNPGPSQLYHTVPDHFRNALKEGVLSMSHRNKRFEELVEKVKNNLFTLFSIPSNYHLFFAASATEIFERSIQNLVSKKSYHFVNGAFSKKYYEIATQLNKQAIKNEVIEGMGFSDAISTDAELIAITQNETSTGVSLPLSSIEKIKKQNPNSLVSVDAVSSFPYPTFDFTQFDSLLFSVQKCMGMPAGLGVWLVNDRCITKAQEMEKAGESVGTYHSISSLYQFSKKNQTPETPNVLAIYVLGKILDDFIERGIDVIRRETDYKAAVLYQALEQHPNLQIAVSQKEFRSSTVIVAQTNEHTESLKKYLQTFQLQAGSGYGKGKDSQLRFANFPAHSKESFELLADKMAAWKP